MDNEDVVYTLTHTHTEYYSAVEKILPFAAIWMDLEGTALSKISQKKTSMISLLCGI